jgi:hypothetical protein
VARPDLDAWVPRADALIRVTHSRAADADPDALWAAAERVCVHDARRLGRVVRWRIPGVSIDQTFAQMFRAYPFALLEAGERHSLSGLVGRIWTIGRDYPPLRDAEEFRTWSQPGTDRVLFAHWAEPDGSGRAVLHSEVRVAPVDGRAALRTRAVWTVVRVFERLIGSEALALAARRAERG